jgi:hypothetical protein
LEIKAMLEQTQEIATLAATLIGIWIAASGLNAWKRETTGKRDIELCQKVIEMFYEAEQRMSTLRSPLYYAGEGSERQREDGEGQEETDRRNRVFAPLARLNKQLEFWAEFFSYQFRMRALFGETAVTPFDLVSQALSHFRAAAITRYEGLRDSQSGLDVETRRGLERTISTIGPDDIGKQMTKAIEEMEAICIPIVRATRPAGLMRRLIKR